MVKKCPSCGYNNRDDASFCSSCGASLAGAAVPVLKPVPSVRVVTPVSPGGPIRVPPPGQCYYHPNLPAVYVCNRCGRSICRDDSKAYMDLVLCPQCYQGVVPMVAQPQPPAPAYAPAPPAYAPPPMAPAYGPPPMAPVMAPPPPVPVPAPAAAFPVYPPPPMIAPAPPRAMWGFILSVIAGILVILNAAALLAPGFYVMWVGVFFWLPALGPPSLAFAIGVIIGLILVIGSILMLLGYGTIGSIVVFPMAVLSLIIGGGFVAGFVLGVLGGILGMLGR
ncbi:MAG TPA: zinc-ribbon domain-containing protein [Candidatus Acidoferrales bacterium]|nr:zinc-ribbon domain-containing protein [Candidatus Acidoferrales bacterium]